MICHSCLGSGVQDLQQTADLAQSLSAGLGVECRRFQFLLPKHDPNQSDVGFLLLQVSGKGLAQAVRRDVFLDTGRVSMDGSVKLPGAQGLDRVADLASQHAT